MRIGKWSWRGRKHEDYILQPFVTGDMLTGNSSRDSQKATTIRWNGLQQIFEEGMIADTLIIMDAAYYPASKLNRQRGVLELIAAAISDEHYTAIGRCAFTLSFAELLRNRATRQSPLSVAELHSILCTKEYPRIVHNRNVTQEKITDSPAPLHLLMSGNSRLPSIFLSPVQATSPFNSTLYENNPLIQMSVRLKDDNVDVDSWNEWLRLMPSGVRDVKVEGPFRATYR